MGLAIFPIIILSFILFVCCSLYIAQCIKRGELRIMSVGEGALVAVLMNVLFFSIWNAMGTVWVLAPVITIPLVTIIFPGVYWFYDKFMVKNKDSRWAQASAWCVIFGTLLFLFLYEKLEHIDQLLNVTLTH
jgi:hypothetical protein